MFVTKSIIYLQVQKTGSTHITKVLRKYYGGKTNTKHEQLKDLSIIGDRLVATSVRNPWDWYVSLWAYGCQGQGGLRKYFDHLPLSEIRQGFSHPGPSLLASLTWRLPGGFARRARLRRLYSDSTNAAHFREWLTMLLGDEGLYMTKEAYAASPVKTLAGFMSYRYLALSMRYDRWQAEGCKITDAARLATFVEEATVANHIIRTEQLNQDLAALLQKAGKKVTVEDLDAIEKTNVSTHRKYADYYDAETTELVRRRDSLIIERFGYSNF